MRLVANSEINPLFVYFFSSFLLSSFLFLSFRLSFFLFVKESDRLIVHFFSLVEDFQLPS